MRYPVSSFRRRLIESKPTMPRVRWDNPSLGNTAVVPSYPRIPAAALPATIVPFVENPRTLPPTPPSATMSNATSKWLGQPFPNCVPSWQTTRVESAPVPKHQQTRRPTERMPPIRYLWMTLLLGILGIDLIMGIGLVLGIGLILGIRSSILYLTLE